MGHPGRQRMSQIPMGFRNCFDLNENADELIEISAAISTILAVPQWTIVLSRNLPNSRDPNRQRSGA